MSLSLRVVANKHNNAVSKDNPSAVREIGFKVTATLTATGSDISPSTLQEKYPLEQWVTDKFWLQTRPSEKSSQWTDQKEQSTGWQRDEFGRDEDRGEWHSERHQTKFSDEPGFLGRDKRHGRGLNTLERLGDYEISFYWKVGSKPPFKTEIITLKAEPDDDSNITYTAAIDKTWTVIE